MEFRKVWHAGERAIIFPTEEDEKEFLSMVERSKPVKPLLSGDGYWNGELVMDTWECQGCGAFYEVDIDDYKYCPECGQAIDWSEEEWSEEDEQTLQDD